jgi:hypothetical protein
MRLGVPDEEAVKEWRTAYHALDDLVHVADRIGEGTLVAVMDAQERARIALQRARERIRQATRGRVGDQPTGPRYPLRGT